MNESFSIQGCAQTNSFVCYINGDNIIQTDYLGQQKVIGKTAQAYADLESTTTEYYNKLVELGVITPPVSQEEMISKMQKSMTDMCDMIASLKAELEGVKNRGCACHSANDQSDVSGVKTERGRRTGAAADSGDGG